MKRILIATTLAMATSCAAYAQDPAPKPDANAEHPPTNRMGEATPTMKAPSGAEHAPTNRLDQAVPPMKPTDPQSADTGTKPGTSADTGTKAGTFTASDEWIGRAIYSSDGKELGKVASVQQGDLNADLGGFLGLGATRTLIKADQIQDVKDDRIVLRLTETEAKNLPAAEEKSPQQ